MLLERGTSVKLGRFIPTRVGNADSSPTALIGTAGSSPRVWGMLTHEWNGQGGIRFIPTRVGNAAQKSETA